MQAPTAGSSVPEDKENAGPGGVDIALALPIVDRMAILFRQALGGLFSFFARQHCPDPGTLIPLADDSHREVGPVRLLNPFNDIRTMGRLLSNAS